MSHSLEGWNIGRFDTIDWIPWDTGELARAKILAVGDGYHVALVEALAGYTGSPHEHTYAEFFYVVNGSVRTQDETMNAGDAYAAAAGSKHTDFHVDNGATYLVIFKI